MSSMLKRLFIFLHIIPDDPLTVLHKEWYNHGGPDESWDYSAAIQSQLIERVDEIIEYAAYVRRCIVDRDYD
ncbi:MAG: hypothetical protein EOP45_09945 [Sphingobacteriaceae bacterium]|nr:MAG: hypothetical protein EOP45_09945 [Sphingobacteriaceae bacterium]